MAHKPLRGYAFDDKRPVVTIEDGVVHMTFEAREPADGSSLLDPPYFVVEIQDCGKGRVFAGVQSWDVALGLREAPPTEYLQPGYGR